MQYRPTLVPFQFCTQSFSAEGCFIARTITNHMIKWWTISTYHTHQQTSDRTRFQKEMAICFESPSDTMELTAVGQPLWWPPYISIHCLEHQSETQPRSFPEPHYQSQTESGITEIVGNENKQETVGSWCCLQPSPTVILLLGSKHSRGLITMAAVKVLAAVSVETAATTDTEGQEMKMRQFETHTRSSSLFLLASRSRVY